MERGATVFRECFHFNLKIHLRSAAFLLAAVASILFTVFSQLPYFEHYQLKNESDLQQIRNRLSTDSNQILFNIVPENL